MRAALKRALELGGFRVSLAGDGATGLSAAESVRPDLVVLDILMPGVDGFEVCREMRARGDRTPILMLTARDAVADRVEGLEAGADDYLPKPFALEELLARVRALLRRTTQADDQQPLRFADLELDPVSYTVKRGDRVLELTRTEHLLLELFLENPRRVLPRQVIFDRVWDYDFGPRSKALNVYVSYLRKKTEAAGEPRLIHTVRGVGYVLREP
jgi:two-component system, OmpR family, response regulator MprA